MKKLKAFGLLVVVLALGLAFIACNSRAGAEVTGGGGSDNEGVGKGGGSTSGGGGGGTSKTPGVLTFTDGEYEVIITQKLGVCRTCKKIHANSLSFCQITKIFHHNSCY